MNKKILSLMISFALIIAVIPPVQVNAEDSAKSVYVNNTKSASATCVNSKDFVTLSDLKSMFGNKQTFAAKSDGLIINGVYVKIQINSQKYNLRDVVRILNYSYKQENGKIYIDMTKPYTYSSADGVAGLSGHTLPTLTIDGKWPCSKKLLQTAWAMYFPYMCKYLGLPTDFFRSGVHWVWDEAIQGDTVDFKAAEDTVYMGPIFKGQYIGDQYNYDYEILVRQMIHETGHLWIQSEDGSELMSFDFGQWIWEANTMIVEALTDTIYFKNNNDNWSAYKYDNTTALGDALNGVKNDGNKYQRTNTDSAAVRALYIMANILSDDYTYFAKVNKLRIAWAKENASNVMDADSYAKLLDQAADGKTIDGMKPSEWLFSQPVANIEGSTGNFLTLFAADPTNNMGYESGLEVYVNLAAFTRSRQNDGLLKETGVTATATLKAYNTAGKVVATKSIDILPNESTSYRFGVPASCKGQVLKLVATANVNGKVLKSVNYAITGMSVGSRGNANMIFILTDSKSNVVTGLKKSDINITGASETDYSHLPDGFIVVKVQKDDTVSVKIRSNKYQYTKPYGSRVITLKLSN